MGVRYLVRPFELKGIDKLVYECIYEKIYDYKDMLCKYTYRQISEDIRKEFGLEYNPKQIMKSIKSMEESKYLQVLEKGKKGTPTTFKLEKILTLDGKQIRNEYETNEKQIDVEKSTLARDVETNKKQIRNKKETPYKDIYNIYSLVLDRLNKIASTNYKSTTKSTQSLINARVREGYVLDDFYKVIDVKAKEWINTDMEKYLRPSTLFGTKFENYLNQGNKKAPIAVGAENKNNNVNHSICNNYEKYTKGVKMV